jgi:hypothetical protein
MRAKPWRQGIGAASVAWTISQPDIATVPEEKAGIPGKKR